ncbi:MAG: UDP-2,3-diacylglucosamine diphosphatase, partial [Flavitalea sp.]
VVCGHIHQPEIREISNDKGSITYLNSGDWIENLTSLEYHKGEWSIYRFADAGLIDMILDGSEDEKELSNNELFTNLLTEFNMMK